jgi:hypothetical protein
MKNTITRRTLASTVFAAAVAARTAPLPPAAGNAEAELQAARDENQRDVEALDKVALTPAAEPAFHFTA